MPGWWAVAPVGERRFLGGLARMMRSAKRSKLPDVTQAAVKWERALGCFIKVRLIREADVHLPGVYVITSYSIHYTKLYDSRLPDVTQFYTWEIFYPLMLKKVTANFLQQI